MYDGKNSKEALDEVPKQQIEQLAFQLVRVKKESRILKRDTAFFKEIRDQRNDEVLSLLYE